MFEDAVRNSENPLCYNGDIFSAEDWITFKERFPHVEAVMLGRGLLQNPALAEEIDRAAEKGRKEEGRKVLPKEEWERLKDFHDDVLNGYREAISGDRNVLFKMKELWSFLAPAFTDCHKYAKRIKKAEKLPVYEAAVNDLFAEQSLEVHEP